MLEQLKALDIKFFLTLNGCHNAFFDPIMYWVSNKLFWIPLYLIIAILIIRFYKLKSIYLFLGIGVLITLADQLSSGLIKPWVERLRPSHNPDLQGLVHLSAAGPGGMYGFVSSHAANTFALFLFLSLVLSKKFSWLKYILAFWATLTSYSRIYVGVHYPGDVLAGALLGSLLGILLAWILLKWLHFPKEIGQVG